MRNRSTIRGENILSQLNVLRQLPPETFNQRNQRDIQQLSSDLDSLSRIPFVKRITSNPEQIANISAGIFFTTNLLLSANDTWNQFSSQERRQVSSRILGILERTGSQSGVPPHRLSTSRLEQIVKQLSFGQQNISEIMSNEDAIHLYLNESSNVSFAFTQVIGIAQYLQPDHESELRNYSVQSQIISIKQSDNISSAEVEYVSHHCAISLTETKRKCAWLSLENGTWSTTGCQVQSEKSHERGTSCRCNHLANFAVLMDFTGSTAYMTEQPAHSLALFLLTVIGCFLSFICLILSLLTFGVLLKDNSSRNALHFNMCLCLLLVNLLSLINAFFRPDRLGVTACCVVAGFLHYFLLAAFFWMLCEGIELWFLVVRVFETNSRTKIYFLISYCE